MLTSVKITNYKSIETVKLGLSRINVLIGENGAGKSNILEAIAIAGAASAGKLDNEFLSSRGIRVTDPRLMRQAFSGEMAETPIEVEFMDTEKEVYLYRLNNDNAPYSQWQCSFESSEHHPISFPRLVKEMSENGKIKKSHEKETIALLEAIFSLKERKKINNFEKKAFSLPESSIELEFERDSPFVAFLKKHGHKIARISEHLSNFIIYSPENTSLRLFEREGQIEPLGINGEGLFKLLNVMLEGGREKSIEDIRTGLKLFGWFEDFEVVKPLPPKPGGIQVKDRFVGAAHRILDQKSVNEGFLFLLFYGALFSSELTPRFFAIDNIDASLNPKLCQRLMTHLTKLAKENGKQVILTTHNPAVLDGLNLDDDDQRLFVVSRGGAGQTRVRKVEKKALAEGAPDIRLSEAFLRGSLGGLPKGF